MQDLLDQLLVLDPKKRMTISKALEHKIFNQEFLIRSKFQNVTDITFKNFNNEVNKNQNSSSKHH